MSVEAITWAFKQSPASAADKFVLVALANFAGETHQCFPSRKKLAEMAMVSVDTIDRAIARLCEGGFIVKDERLHTKGGRASNCYTLQIDAPSRNVRLPAETTLAAQSGHPQPHVAPTLAASACGQGSRNGAATKEPLKEPSKEVADDAEARAKLSASMKRITDAAKPILRDGGMSATLMGTSSEIAKWLKDGCDIDADILPVIEAAVAKGAVVSSWKFFSQSIVDAKASREAPLPTAVSKGVTHAADRNRAPRHPTKHDRLQAVVAKCLERNAGPAARPDWARDLDGDALTIVPGA